MKHHKFKSLKKFTCEVCKGDYEFYKTKEKDMMAEYNKLFADISTDEQMKEKAYVCDSCFTILMDKSMPEWRMKLR